MKVLATPFRGNGIQRSIRAAKISSALHQKMSPVFAPDRRIAAKYYRELKIEALLIQG
jgi:hypothetical protein